MLTRPYGQKKKRKELMLSVDSLNFLIETFPDGHHSDGVDRSINCYRTLFDGTLEELKGFFTKEEVNGLFQCHFNKANDRDTQYSVSAYQVFIKEQVKRNRADFLRPNKTLEKVERLTSAQVFFLREYIERFWHLRAPGKAQMSLEKAMGKLI